MRLRHLYQDSTVAVPQMDSEKDIWTSLLGLDELHENDRVSIIHYFEVDILVKASTDGQAIFDSIDRVGPTKYQFTDTGNFSKISPARPAASKAVIADSIFYGISKLLYSDYIKTSLSWFRPKSASSNKRVKKDSIMDCSEPISPPLFSPFLNSDTVKAGRKPEIPYNENFFATSTKVVSLIKAMHDHGRACTGNILIRRDNITLKRLTGSIIIKCALGGHCKLWDRGTFAWVSAGSIPIPNSTRSAYVPDVLYSLACYITPTTKGHADQFLTSMLLTPPSRRALNDLIGHFVEPYLLREKEKLIQIRCDELANLNEGLIINMDVGYTGARKAQCATVMVGSGSKILFSRTDTDNGAWLKEGILVSMALNEAINIRKLDVVAVEIDDNASNKKKIESYKRVNGPEEYKDENVKGLNDVFHAAKSMGRQAIKLTSVFVEQMKSRIKPLAVLSFERNLDQSLLQPILTSLGSNYLSYFSDIEEKFRYIGAVEWKEANVSPSNMRDLADRLRQVDEKIDYQYWSPVVVAWNETKAPSSIFADNISGVMITKQTSMKCLLALAVSLSKLLSGQELNDTNKSNALEYLRANLPSVCFRGDNFCANSLECLENAVKHIANDELQSETSEVNKKRKRIINPL